MKRVFVILLFVVMLSGCSNEEVKVQRTYEHVQFVSEIDEDDCLLCGGGTEHEIHSYLGQNNIGLIDLNTFDVELIETNRYDAHGTLIEEATGEMYIGSSMLNETFMYIVLDSDRGYAHVDTGPRESGIDPDAINDYLCQACLDAFSECYYKDDDPSSVAVINFKTQEIRPLVQSCSWFMFGDYAVTCEIKEHGGASLKVYFAPVRYQSQSNV